MTTKLGTDSSKKVDKKYISVAGYMCRPGSERIEIGDSIIFASDAHQTVFVYKRGYKTPVVSFHSESWDDYRAKVSSLIAFAKQSESQKLASKASHTLCKGTVMVCHTNIKNPAEDTVRFFQVEEILPCGEVSFYELLADTIAFTGCKQSIPLVGMKVGALQQSTVLVDSISIDGNLIGRKLAYQSINLDGVELKVYEAQFHSLFA